MSHGASETLRTSISNDPHHLNQVARELRGSCPLAPSPSRTIRTTGTATPTHTGDAHLPPHQREVSYDSCSVRGLRGPATERDCSLSSHTYDRNSDATNRLCSELLTSSSCNPADVDEILEMDDAALQEWADAGDLLTSLSEELLGSNMEATPTKGDPLVNVLKKTLSQQ